MSRLPKTANSMKSMTETTREPNNSPTSLLLAIFGTRNFLQPNSLVLGPSAQKRELSSPSTGSGQAALQSGRPPRRAPQQQTCTSALLYPTTGWSLWGRSIVFRRTGSHSPGRRLRVAAAFLFDARRRRFRSAVRPDVVRHTRVLADEAVEFEIRHVEKRVAGGNVFVDHFDELEAFLIVQFAAVLVHALEIHGSLGSGLIVAGFEAPDVEPVSGAGTIDAEEV